MLFRSVEVDGLEQPEEFDAELRVFVEVLVNHLKRALEYAVHDWRNFVIHQVLQSHRLVYRVMPTEEFAFNLRVICEQLS